EGSGDRAALARRERDAGEQQLGDLVCERPAHRRIELVARQERAGRAELAEIGREVQGEAVAEVQDAVLDDAAGLVSRLDAEERGADVVGEDRGVLLEHLLAAEWERGVAHLRLCEAREPPAPALLA